MTNSDGGSDPADDSKQLSAKAVQPLIEAQTRAGVHEFLVSFLRHRFAADWVATVQQSEDELVPVATAQDSTEHRLRSPISRDTVLPSLLEQSIQWSQSGLFPDIANRRSETATTGSTMEAAPNPHSVLISPIDTRTAVVVTDSRPGQFTTSDLVMVDELTALAASAIERIDATADGHQSQTEAGENYQTAIDSLMHDLQNPLNVALGNLAHARETMDDHDGRLDQIEFALDRIGELIDGLGDLTSIEGHGSDRSFVDIATIAREVWNGCDTAGATLEYDSIRIEANEGWIRRILENLFTNAIQHGSPETVRIVRLDSGTGFAVEDDGLGTDPVALDRLFDVGVTTDPEGTGMGLAIVEKLAEHHGWRVGVSAAPNGGLRFEFTDVNVID